LYNSDNPPLPHPRPNAISKGLTFFYFDLLSPFSALSHSIQTTTPGCRIPVGSTKQETTDMPAGTVKWFNTTKGYGFIAPEDGGKDIFVHISAVERSGLTGLADNQKVTYELRSGRDGRESADDIQLA
jgi:CspA family cold shock protein